MPSSDYCSEAAPDEQSTLRASEVAPERAPSSVSVGEASQLRASEVAPAAAPLATRMAAAMPSSDIWSEASERQVAAAATTSEELSDLRQRLATAQLEVALLKAQASVGGSAEAAAGDVVSDEADAAGRELGQDRTVRLPSTLASAGGLPFAPHLPETNLPESILRPARPPWEEEWRSRPEHIRRIPIREWGATFPVAPAAAAAAASPPRQPEGMWQQALLMVAGGAAGVADPLRGWVVMPTLPVDEPTHLECWTSDSHPGATKGAARAHAQKMPDCMGFTWHMPSNWFFFIKGGVAFANGRNTWRLDAIATGEWQTHFLRERASPTEAPAGATAASNAADFRLLERVMVRDSEHEAWKPGVVAELYPLKVWPDGWHSVCEWKCVQPLERIGRGARVEAMVQSQWCPGVVVCTPPVLQETIHEQQGYWVVQLDQDAAGELAQTRFVRLFNYSDEQPPQPGQPTLEATGRAATAGATRAASTAPAPAPAALLATSLFMRAAQAAALASPKGWLIRDPRSQESAKLLAIVACSEGVLSFGYDLADERARLAAPCSPGRRLSFASAGGAFAALRFWTQAADFGNLVGEQAAAKARQLSAPDLTHGGFGSSWNAMLAVLDAKFAPLTRCAMALVETGDAFLHGDAEPNSAGDVGRAFAPPPLLSARDALPNQFGLQLMILRDELSGRRAWAPFLATLVDPSTGRPRGAAAAQRWAELAQEAAEALRRQREAAGGGRTRGVGGAATT